MHLSLIASRPVAAARLIRPAVLAVLAVAAIAPPAGAWAEDKPSEPLRLMARSRVETKKGSGRFHALTKELRWNPKQTAIVVCDMWDRHWCKGATRRVGQMAPRMNEVIKAARARGVLIIHCPSSCMKYYKDTPQVKLALQAPKVATKVPLKGWCHLDKGREAGLPIDDSDGGCDCTPQCRQGGVWRWQTKAIEIKPGDAITDNAQAYYLMRQRGVKNVIVMGVHTNMCVLGRPFSIRQMNYQGQNVVLMRDMTDTMYNPRKRPVVSHFTGTDLVTDHIEAYWCPTITSSDFVGGPAFRFPRDKRKHIVFVMAEDEYKTNQSLPKFALSELGKDFKLTFVHGSETKRNDIPGIEALADADLAFFSIRRRTLPAAQLKIVRKYLDAGKPLVAIRTASHGFSLLGGKPLAAGHAAWEKFDADVLGGNYHGHHGNKAGKDPKTFVRVVSGAAKHPILAGVRTDEFPVTSWLYKTSPLAKAATPLLMGRVEGRKPHEPVAWTHTYKGGRVFYTSMGHVNDFKMKDFRRLLTNAARWASGQKTSISNDPLESK